jgi:hypothetical protein
MQPRAEPLDFGAGEECTVRLEHRVLRRFLGVVIAHQARTVANQSLAMTAHDRFEGAIRARPGQLDQPFIAVGGG